MVSAISGTLAVPFNLHLFGGWFVGVFLLPSEIPSLIPHLSYHLIPRGFWFQPPSFTPSFLIPPIVFLDHPLPGPPGAGSVSVAPFPFSFACFFVDLDSAHIHSFPTI